MESGRAYEIAYNGLQNGELAFIDRVWTYSNAPTGLEGTTFIKTAHQDRRSSSDSFLTFDVNLGVTVYIAHDDRITTPSWLTSFTDTGDDIVI